MCMLFNFALVSLTLPNLEVSTETMSMAMSSAMVLADFKTHSRNLSTSFEQILIFKTNGYKLMLPSGGPSGKYTKY